MKPRTLPPNRAEQLCSTQAWAAVWPEVRAAGASDRQLGAKVEKRAKSLHLALADRKYEQVLSLCARGKRWQVLRTLASTLTDAEYWRCLRYVYEDTESLWRERTVGRLLTALRPGREGFMTEAERAALAQLPDQVTVHRGAQPHNVAGWAWTLDPARARWFALRFNRSVGLIVHGQVPRADIIGYLDGRGEAEVVCDLASVALDSVEVVRAAAERSR